MKVTIGRLSFLSYLCLAVVLPSLSQTPARDAATEALIEIDASKPLGYKIPRTIFGSFLEPIGNSIYGGLWAEVLENPSFEDNLWSAGKVEVMVNDEPGLARASELGLPLPWEPLDGQQGNRYEPRSNDAANSSRSLLIMGLPDKKVGVRQKVYLPVHRTLHYTGSLYAKHSSGTPEMEVSVRQRNHADNVFARTVIELPDFILAGALQSQFQHPRRADIIIDHEDSFSLHGSLFPFGRFRRQRPFLQRQAWKRPSNFRHLSRKRAPAAFRRFLKLA